MRWEYLVEEISEYSLKVTLNRYGEQEWELISVNKKDGWSGYFICIFKRQKDF
jgi:hypothetical protein